MENLKEYLRKNSDGTYSYIGMVQPENISQNVIEIPEGSETFNYYDRKDNLFFLKGGGEDTMFSNDINDWDWKHWGDIDFDGVVCLWSRHTIPEELPFIDDEPKEYLREDGNGSYILELTCKQEATEPHAKHWIEVPVGVNFYYSFASGDKVFTKEHSSLGRLLWQRKTYFSINDQYAEIEQVRQSGMKFDGNKPRYSLLPKGVVNSVVEVLEFGAKKYSADNWQEVDNAEERYYNAAMRHIDSWWNGEKRDPETGIHHLAHAATNLFFLMWFDNK